MPRLPGALQVRGWVGAQGRRHRAGQEAQGRAGSCYSPHYLAHTALHPAVACLLSLSAAFLFDAPHGLKLARPRWGCLPAWVPLLLEGGQPVPRPCPGCTGRLCCVADAACSHFVCNWECQLAPTTVPPLSQRGRQTSLSGHPAAAAAGAVASFASCWSTDLAPSTFHSAIRPILRSLRAAACSDRAAACSD